MSAASTADYSHGGFLKTNINLTTEEDLAKFLLLRGDMLCQIRALRISNRPMDRRSLDHNADDSTTCGRQRDKTLGPSFEKQLGPTRTRDVGTTATPALATLDPIGTRRGPEVVPSHRRLLCKKQRKRAPEAWLVQTARHVDAQGHFHARSSLSNKVIHKITQSTSIDPHYVVDSEGGQRLRARCMNLFDHADLGRLTRMADWEVERDDLAREMQVVTDRYTQLFAKR
ncbi:hypothetical protein LTR95_009370 [Oleoguttula sp. CCFEE 5521]